jgi:ubiquinol-cytochrome c reductase iron-sulfur subunit
MDAHSPCCHTDNHCNGGKKPENFVHPHAHDAERRGFLGIVFTAFTALGAGALAWPFLKSLAPARDVKAMSTTDVDLSTIAPGQTKTVLWRGSPVFVWHRTAEEIATAAAGDTETGTLLDPQTDAERVKKKEWLVVSAVCTHLGCVPMKGGEFGGWRCPCHGSQFDNSGRLRRGPAATNLPLVPYTFLNDTTIRIG